jgi:hypothetical protein
MKWLLETDELVTLCAAVLQLLRDTQLGQPVPETHFSANPLSPHADLRLLCHAKTDSTRILQRTFETTTDLEEKISNAVS